MMNAQTLNQKVAEIRSLERQINMLQKQLEATKSELKNELDERMVDSIDTGAHKIFYNIYNKESVDTEKLKTANLYSQFSKKQTVIQFKITDKKVVDEEAAYVAEVMAQKKALGIECPPITSFTVVSGSLN